MTYLPRFATAAGAALALVASSPADAVVSVAKQADKAADMIGVNTHVFFRGSVYDANFATWVKPRLVELGVRHIREDQGGCSSAAQADVKDLAAAGIRVDLTTTGSDPDTALADVKNCVNALNTAGSVIEAVEARNEPDGSWWPNAAAWAPWQQKLHDLLVGPGGVSWRSNFASSVLTFSPPLADAANAPGVLNATFSGSTQAARASNAALFYKYVNGHFYPSGDFPEGPLGGGYGQPFTTSLSVLKNNLGSLPAVVSEWGYKQCGPGPGHPVVTQRAAAKYIPRGLLQQFSRSIKYSYIYALLDDSECFGLIDGAGVPKQAFYALKNTIALLKDPGANFAAGSLDYTLSGNTANVRTALLQKRSGVFDLVLWLAVGSSTGGDGTTPAGDIEPAPQAVTVTLGAQAAKVVGYRPTFTNASFQTWTNPSNVSASVRDEITVFEITPQSGVVAAGTVAAQKPPAVEGLADALRRTHRLP